MNIAGRTCPIDYKLPKELFNRESDFKCDSLYVVGGLYGNIEALKTIKEMSKGEDDVRIIYNGDMHWFDKDKEDFVKVELMTADDLRLLGNVESELVRDTDAGLGCGCAYPSYVAQDSVDRSNIIHRAMRDMARSNSDVLELLADRGRVAIVDIAGVKVAVTHGDEQYLAGWRCSWDDLQQEERQEELNTWMGENGVKVLVTTHTCAPVAMTFENGAIINNGASGMPNFEEELAGLITRISVKPCEDALYRACVDGIYVEAVPVRFDRDAFIEWFDRVWPEGSPASVSYRNRIVNGVKGEKPEYAIFGDFEIV